MSEDDTTNTTVAQTTAQSDGERDTLDPSSTAAFQGEFSDGSGAGVLGRNTADSGTPIGVEGAVPNAQGYGLATPDHARVGGTMELTALAGAVTRGRTVTNLLGDGLSVESGALTAPDAGIEVSDGATTVSNVEAISFDGLTLTDDGNGSVTIDR